MKNCPRPSALSRAFTLIELLVAMSILAVFVVMAMQLTGDMLGQWETVNSKVKLNMQARLALDLIERDLKTAFVRQDGGEWLRWEPEDVTAGTIKAPAGKLMFFSQAGEAHYTDNSTQFGLAAVAYEVAYADPLLSGNSTASRKRLGLYRLAIDPAYTFETAFLVDTPPADLNTDLWSVLPQELQITLPSNLLVENIVGFRVTFDYYKTSGNLTISTSDADDIVSIGVGANRTLTIGADEIPHGQLLAAEVTLWLLDNKGASLLRNGLPFSEKELLQRHAHPFSKKIELPSP